jgi:hypothetical protein
VSPADSVMASPADSVMVSPADSVMVSPADSVMVSPAALGFVSAEHPFVYAQNIEVVIRKLEPSERPYPSFPPPPTLHPHLRHATPHLTSPSSSLFPLPPTSPSPSSSLSHLFPPLPPHLCLTFPHLSLSSPLPLTSPSSSLSHLSLLIFVSLLSPPPPPALNFELAIAFPFLVFLLYLFIVFLYICALPRV